MVTVQDGQKFRFEGGESKTPLEVAVPYTIGKWQQTPPIELTLANGKNVIRAALLDGSRGVTVKDFTLSPVK